MRIVVTMFDRYFMCMSSRNSVIADNKEVTTGIQQTKYNFICRDQISTLAAQFKAFQVQQ